MLSLSCTIARSFVVLSIEFLRSDATRRSATAKSGTRRFPLVTRFYTLYFTKNVGNVESLDSFLRNCDYFIL